MDFVVLCLEKAAVLSITDFLVTYRILHLLLYLFKWLLWTQTPLVIFFCYFQIYINLLYFDVNASAIKVPSVEDSFSIPLTALP